MTDHYDNPIVSDDRDPRYAPRVRDVRDLAASDTDEISEALRPDQVPPPPAPPIPVVLAQPVATRHGPANVIDAGNVEFVGGELRPVLAGRVVSDVGGQTIAGLVLIPTSGTVQLAPNEYASVLGRAALVAAAGGAPIWLPGVAYVWLYAAAVPGTASWVLIGGMH